MIIVDLAIFPFSSVSFVICIEVLLCVYELYVLKLCLMHKHLGLLCLLHELIPLLLCHSLSLVIFLIVTSNLSSINELLCFF